MFKALKDFFKTLKMEAVGIGVRSEKRIRPPAVFVEDLSTSVPGVVSVGFEVELGELHGSIEDVEVRSELIGSETLEVRDIWFGEGDSLEIHRAELGGSSIEINGIDALRVPDVLSETPGFSVGIGLVKRIEIPKSIDGTRERVVWIMRMKRSTSYPKTAVLEALERFLKRYTGDPKDLKFLGFYRSVPLGRAKRVWFIGDSMMLELSRRGKDMVLDVIALKTERGIDLEVVGKDAGGNSRRYSRGR